MSHPSPQSAVLRDQPDTFRLAVEADPDTNLLLRLLEPFVIHDVLPQRVDCAAGADALSVELVFSSEEAVAVRLHQRLSVMFGVRDAALVRACGARPAGTLAA